MRGHAALGSLLPTRTCQSGAHRRPASARASCCVTTKPSGAGSSSDGLPPAAPLTSNSAYSNHQISHINPLTQGEARRGGADEAHSLYRGAMARRAAMAHRAALAVLLVTLLAISGCKAATVRAGAAGTGRGVHQRGPVGVYQPHIVYYVLEKRSRPFATHAWLSRPPSAARGRNLCADRVRSAGARAAAPKHAVHVACAHPT
jgi:hypothetical protein